MCWAGARAKDRTPLERWRIPIGDSGILGFFQSLIARTTTEPTLALNSLKIVGNSCAEKGAELLVRQCQCQWPWP